MGNWGQAIHDYGPTIAVLLGFWITSIKSRGHRENELDAIKKWTETHQAEANQRDAAIGELQRIAASMESTAKGQDRRLELLEERKH